MILLEGRAGDSDTFDSSAIDNRHDVITGLSSNNIHRNLTGERDTVHKLASGFKRIAFKINAPLVVSDIGRIGRFHNERNRISEDVGQLTVRVDASDIAFCDNKVAGLSHVFGVVSTGGVEGSSRAN